MATATKTKKPKKADHPANGVPADVLPDPTPASFVVEEIPLPDVGFRKGNREHIDKGSLDELAESMRKRGLLNDVLVRRAIDGYECVAGERRTRAARLLGWKTIRAKVFAIDTPDHEIREIGLVENLQRQDLTPFEEAKHLAGLRELHPTMPVEELARRVGRGPQWVAQRLAVGRLIPELRKLVEEQDWPLSHLPILARVPADGQSDLFKFILAQQENDYDGDWTDRVPRSAGGSDFIGRAPSLRVLEDALQDLQHQLAKAAWELDDVDLLPAAGACSACPKRSGAEALLFPELDAKKDDRCLDTTCWRKKEAALVALNVAKLKAKGTEPILLEEYNHARDEDHAEVLGAIGGDAEPEIKPSHSMQKVKKSDKGARPAVVINGPRAGTVEYVKPYSHSSSNGSAKKTRAIDQETGKAEPPSTKERLKTLEQKRQCRAVELWMERLETLKPPFKNCLDNLLVHFGTNDKLEHRNDHDWRDYHKAKDPLANAWEQLHPIFAHRLERWGGMDKCAAELWNEAQAQAEALDELTAWQKCWADAVEEIKLSKALTSQGVKDPAAKGGAA